MLHRSDRGYYITVSPPYSPTYLPLPPDLLAPHYRHLFLVLSSNKLRDRSTVLQLLLQILIHRKRDGLSRRNAHDSRGDTLVKGVEALLLEHLRRNHRNALPCRHTWHRWGLLETGLDGVDRSVGEGSHGSRDETDQGGLVGWELGGGVGLVGLKDLLEFGVGGEVDGLVGSCVVVSGCCVKVLHRAMVMSNLGFRVRQRLM